VFHFSSFGRRPAGGFVVTVPHKSVAECFFIRFSIQSANRDQPRHPFNFEDDDKEIKSHEPAT
jgi:hypothetical protein